MGTEEISLSEKRAELKRVINEGLEKTYPARFFYAVGRVLARAFRLRKEPHWLVSALVLGLVLFLPGILVALAKNEISHWTEFHYVLFALVILGYLAPVVSHCNVVYNVLPGIRDGVVDSIQSVTDLSKLESWLSLFWSPRIWITFILWLGIVFNITFILGNSLSSGGFIGFGLSTMALFVFPFYAFPFVVIAHVLTLPSQLAGMQLKLYESDPVHSEVIQRLINILNVYIYIVAGYVAGTTAVVSLHPATTWFVIAVILFGWVPTILQFLINQYAVRRMIITAKWGVLNRLQAQIKELQENQLTNVPDTTIARLNQLLDLHDRISAKPNSILTWGTGLSLFNQLMLPLLGLFLGNLGDLLELLDSMP